MLDFEKGERVAKTSVGIFAVIGTVELIFGIQSGSIALTADSAHTFTDALVSAITFFGLRTSRRPPGGRFHFGYHKVETFSAVLSALIMVAVGVLIVYRSFLELRAPEPLTAHFPAMATALGASTVFLLLGLNKRKTAKRINSKSLSFDAFNTLKSSAASFSAFLGISLSYLGFFRIDAVAGLVIGGFIFAVAYITIKESSLILLDACACSVDTLETARRLVESVEGVKKAEDIRLRSAGPFIMGDVVIKVDGKTTVQELEDINAKIEDSVRSYIPNLLKLIIQPKPYEEDGQS
ncbi:cation diffusion facilitator family transporter [Candidatus Hecatella orcuttiae]|uniref:cation diffusion facilitator family transporter n=1 Tax=Candidatus Hecatella orcuttiae TaxID=1935119 RepID=UPI002867C8F6|nr:cation diffusion facilitator family transporter [Candidatus Hecatella orcuttiae]